MDTPDYSAVNTAVEISKKYNLDKLVNGVLRNILRKKIQLTSTLQKKIFQTGLEKLQLIILVKKHYQ